MIPHTLVFGLPTLKSNSLISSRLTLPLPAHSGHPRLLPHKTHLFCLWRQRDLVFRQTIHNVNRSVNITDLVRGDFRLLFSFVTLPCVPPLSPRSTDPGTSGNISKRKIRLFPRRPLETRQPKQEIKYNILWTFQLLSVILPFPSLYFYSVFSNVIRSVFYTGSDVTITVLQPKPM